MHLHSILQKRQLFCASIATLLFVVVICLPVSVFAQKPAVPRKKLGVDQVSTQSGIKIFGIITSRDARIGLSMFVERDWFKKTHPNEYQKFYQGEMEKHREVKTVQLKRLNDWKKSRANDEALVRFIEAETERISNLDNENKPNGNGSKFMVLTLTPDQVKRIYTQKPEQHQIAGLAWKHDLKNVTTRASSDLMKELVKLDVDVEVEKFDFSDDMPMTASQSDKEWNARICVFEYVYRKRLKFQGIGSMLIKIETEKQDDPDAMMGQLLQGGIGGIAGGGSGGLLDDLMKDLDLGGNNRQPKERVEWYKKATDTAEFENSRAVRVTRLTQDISNPVAKVEDFFFVQISEGNWQVLYTATATFNRNDVDQQDIEFLKQDPQIQKVMKIFNSIGGGNAGLLDKALRQGVATQHAMNESSNQFFEFLDRYTKTTDGPPLPTK